MNDVPKRDAKPRRPVGRPALPPGAEHAQRYQVSLYPSLAERLREFGDGSLSAGIARLVPLALPDNAAHADHAKKAI